MKFFQQKITPHKGFERKTCLNVQNWVKKIGEKFVTFVLKREKYISLHGRIFFMSKYIYIFHFKSSFSFQEKLTTKNKSYIL